MHFVCFIIICSCILRVNASKLMLKDVTKDDSHQLMLARLDWELEQRKRYLIKIITR